MRRPQPVRFPLEELWDERGLVSRSCEGELGTEAIRALLKRGQVRFAVADVGVPLQWVPSNTCYAFWKDEVQPRLIEPSVAEQGVALKDLPGEYGYSASIWQSNTIPVVLLQKWH
ncbi:hypothetical protein DAERI_010231 [Deinococcus aerius]|uniref:Uncharacterized protein n=1 Tax=Deinococcus aerius TaxID=200253 RepID=A0A2I9CRD3_9DEIO|nr:hypothetical protein [Deinococcus aerius]GBF04059.1 hypothetical protein DAERI_010231 [Deinococcus aerius]